MAISIDRIYELMYSPIITPWNLVENAKLDNYDYVNFFKKDGYLIVEMKCFTDESEYSIYQYKFDHKDALVEIIQILDDENIILFNRENELLKNIGDNKINKIIEAI